MSKATRTVRPPIEIGQRFGLLVVSGPPEMRLHSTGKLRPFWPLKCDCGAKYVVAADKIKSGEKRSCYGCQPKPGNRKPRTQEEKNNLRKSSTTHGMSKSPEFSTWHAMKSRCYNPNVRHYYNYGGRGVRVCDRWLNSFENFYEDMGPRPTGKYSLDRINNDGHYEPGNCEWRTVTDQNRNKQNTFMIEHEGKIVPLASLTENNLVSRSVVDMRVRLLGWTLQDAISIPLMQKRPKKQRLILD